MLGAPNHDGSPVEPVSDDLFRVVHLVW
jgi:hypothetical protein